MIIPGFGKYQRKLWAQKPKQWGPAKQVRNAIRRYFEDIIGCITPELYYACWENAGSILHDYGKRNNNISLSNISWESSGIVFDGSSSYGESSGTITTNGAFSFYISGLECYYTGNQQDYIFYFIPTTISRILVAFQYYATGKFSISGPNYKNIVGTITHSVGKKITGTVTRDKSNLLTLYNNGVYDGEVASASGNGTGDITIGSRSSTYDYNLNSPIGTMLFINQYCLSYSQIALLNDNPYGAIQPYIPPVYLDLSGGGSTNLVVAEADNLHAADNITLTQTHELTTAETAHDLVSDNVVLITGVNLVVAEANHDIVSDNITLIQDHNLTVAETYHNNVVDNIALTQGQNLTVAEAYHDNISDNLDLTQDHLLSVNESDHLLVDDGPITLGFSGLLIIQEPYHDLTSDNISLTQEHALDVTEAYHDLTNDSVSLEQIHSILVAASDHVHTADSINLTQIHILVTPDGIHVLTDDAPLTLTGAFPLTIQDASHDLVSDNITLNLALVTLILSESYHVLASDNIVLVSSGIEYEILDRKFSKLTTFRNLQDLTEDRRL